MIKHRVEDAFWQGYWVFYLFYPFTWLYRSLMAVRRWYWSSRAGTPVSEKMPPVVVVGNVVLGGSGKTPFVIQVANALTDMGYHVGIISRGYGGCFSGETHWVSEKDSPELVGEEALLMVEKTKSPVVIGKKRVLARNALLATGHYEVILSDDGLQHYALPRALEVVLVNRKRIGTGLCLPAGPLREPFSRLKTADYIFEWGKDLKYELGRPYSLNKSVSSLDPAQPIHAVAGIAYPDAFFEGLRQQGFSNLICHVFSDHHLYRAEELNFSDLYPIVMTEKDAVKCRAFLTDRLWAVPAQLIFLTVQWRRLIDHLVKLIRSRRV